MGSRDFNGTSDHGYATDFGPTEPITVVQWYNAAALPASDAYATLWAGTENSTGYHELRLWGGTCGDCMVSSPAALQATSRRNFKNPESSSAASPATATGVWQLAVGSWGATSTDRIARLMDNSGNWTHGTLDTTNRNCAPNAMSIGCWRNGATERQYFDGLLGPGALWATTKLTQAECEMISPDGFTDYTAFHNIRPDLLRRTWPIGGVNATEFNHEDFRNVYTLDGTTVSDKSPPACMGDWMGQSMRAWV